MQTFKDTETGLYWQFDDEVLVTGTDGARYFNAPHGAVLNVPTTLVPAQLPPPAEPPTPIPQSVSRWQGREAMRLTPYGSPEAGVSVFDAAVALLARPETPAYYLRAWAELQDFEYDSPMLTAVADALGLSKSDRDSLFIFAASLRA